MPVNSPSNGSGNWNEHNLNPLARNHWRASLVPAAAVTPAPIAYIKVVAVKTLVVGFRDVVGQALGRIRKRVRIRSVLFPVAGRHLGPLFTGTVPTTTPLTAKWDSFPLRLSFGQLAWSFEDKGLGMALRSS